MKLSNSVKPISYLKQHTAEIIKKVHENNEAVVITQNGEAKVVILDIADYEQNQETLTLLKMLAQSKNAYEKGEHKTENKAFSDIRNAIKAR